MSCGRTVHRVLLATFGALVPGFPGAVRTLVLPGAVRCFLRMGHGMGRRFAGGAPVAVFGGSPVGNAQKSAETALPAGLPPRSETGEEYINKTHKDS